jgi:hypothetical protein
MIATTSLPTLSQPHNYRACNFACRTRKKATALALSMIAGVLLSSAAFAADSTWLLGDNGQLAVSTLEHREGDGRATSITLILGMHLLTGHLTDADSGKIFLTEIGPVQGGRYKFAGTISMDYGASTVTLRGKLDMAGATDNVNAVFRCKEMHFQ